jgi:chloramphenicol O-acetyltransferase type B
MKRPLPLRVLARLRRALAGKSEPILLKDRFPQYDIGAGSYGGLKVLEFGEGARLRIGAYCSFAEGVQIFLGGEHRPDWVTTYPFNVLRPEFSAIKGHPHTKGDVVIGSDVWIGREAMIMSGVTIGDGAVIGARAVVARDVPPYGIVVGNPAKLVRHRFEPEVVAKLLAIRWWDWPEDRIMAAIPRLLSGDVAGFASAVEGGES